MSEVDWAPSPRAPPLTPGGEPRDGVGSRHQLASEGWLSVQGHPPTHTHTLELGPGTQFLHSDTQTTCNKKEQKRSSLWGDRGKDKSQPVIVLLWKFRNKLVLAASSRNTKWKLLLLICSLCTSFIPLDWPPLFTLPRAQDYVFWPESAGLPGPRLCARGGAHR